MNWQDILQFIISLFGQGQVNNPVPNQTPIQGSVIKIRVIRGVSNKNGQFDVVQILNNDAIVWSGVAGENSILSNLPIQKGNTIFNGMIVHMKDIKIFY